MLKKTALKCDNLVWLNFTFKFKCRQLRARLLTAPARRSPMCAWSKSRDMNRYMCPPNVEYLQRGSSAVKLQGVVIK
jgi:hypothetical protein